MKDRIWISKKIFNWISYPQSYGYVDAYKWARAYEIWERASRLIDKYETSFDLSDGILNLKRSLDQRTKLIEELYSLRQIKYKNKPKGYFEILGDFGAARPFLLKKLLKIRNQIEHEDVNPPNVSECREWLDIIWYFLKSTDAFVKMKREDLVFVVEEKEKAHYGYTINIERYKVPNCYLSGWFPIDLISNIENKGCFEVIIEVKETKKDLKKRRPNETYHDPKLETDTWVLGRAILDGNTYKLLMQHVFSAY